MQEIAQFPSVRGLEKVASLSSDQKRELVQRVIKSQAFSRSPAMRAFLLYVTDHAILGRTDMLKEQSIGTEVLGRRPNYDPADDNIVRVRAHELRERLGKYFAAEGIEEQVVITIPRGAYAPGSWLAKLSRPNCRLQHRRLRHIPAKPRPAQKKLPACPRGTGSCLRRLC